MNLWSVIDGIITFPAFAAGYLWRAYRNTFNHGSGRYVRDVRKYWKGGK